MAAVDEKQDRKLATSPEAHFTVSERAAHGDVS
jgi:hypothetical protein